MAANARPVGGQTAEALGFTNASDSPNLPAQKYTAATARMDAVVCKRRVIVSIKAENSRGLTAYFSRRAIFSSNAHRRNFERSQLTSPAPRSTASMMIFDTRAPTKIAPSLRAFPRSTFLALLMLMIVNGV
jgi:hypothetical protein